MLSSLFWFSFIDKESNLSLLLSFVSLIILSVFKLLSSKSFCKVDMAEFFSRGTTISDLFFEYIYYFIFNNNISYNILRIWACTNSH